MRIGITGDHPRDIIMEGDIYDWNHPTAKLIRNWMNLQIIYLKHNIPLENKITGATGLALGIDQWMARVYNHHNIPFIAFVPHFDQDKFWKEPSKVIYKILLEEAKEIRYTHQGKYPGSWVFLKRNMEIVDWLSEDKNHLLLAIWSGKKSGGTFHTIQYAKKKNVKVCIFDTGGRR